MRQLCGNGLARMLVTALLLGMIAVPVPLVARSQQEIDPTWFGPWAESHPAGARPSKAHAPDHRNNNSTAVALTGRHKAKKEVRGQSRRDASRSQQLARANRRVLPDR